MEAKNILKTKMYELNDEEMVLVIKNWLGREGLQLIKTFTRERNVQDTKRIFSVLSQKFKQYHN